MVLLINWLIDNDVDSKLSNLTSPELKVKKIMELLKEGFIENKNIDISAIEKGIVETINEGNKPELLKQMIYATSLLENYELTSQFSLLVVSPIDDREDYNRIRLYITDLVEKV